MHLFALIVTLVPIAVQLFGTKGTGIRDQHGAGELTVPETTEE